LSHAPAPGRVAAARRILALAGIALAVLAGAAGAGADARLEKLGDEFIDRMLVTRPHLATRLGIHSYDSRLAEVSAATIDRDVAWFREFRPRVEEVDSTRLDLDHRLDRRALLSRIDAELVTLTVLDAWRRDPTRYTAIVAGSIQSLIQRRFASPCSRLLSTARRLRQVPEVLRAARVLIEHPSRPATEAAIRQMEGTLRLYREGVRDGLAGCSEGLFQGDLAEADTMAIRAVEEFIGYLRTGVLPQADSAFALGADAYALKLRYEEMEATPVESLLARGERELEASHARVIALAGYVAPGGSLAAAFDSLHARVPDAETLVPFVSDGLNRIHAFLLKEELLTLPRKAALAVRETPPFQRGTSFASMDAAGVWEHGARDSWYNVLPADPAWSEADRRDHLEAFNRWSVDIITIHEALPGHYYQSLATARLGSRLRQFLTTGSNVEGWAHYCELMMIEQGFGADDARYAFAQELATLQRLGRFVAGLSMHTRGMTVEEATRLFEERCFLEPVNAAREARRGATDPTYIVYTLGRWRILDLREEVRRRLGRRFRLDRFHDALLEAGPGPLPLVRERVLARLAPEKR